ncbi:MAG TPA: hypothetical protein VNL37_00975, partial [Candidatus Polarisedimenticolia bacterium]|nr:hypothetical protein [Candidatus Polarisedimenticolia bacterium]
MNAREPHRAPVVVTVLICAFLTFPTLGARRKESISADDLAAGATADQSSGWQPFEENRGQADSGALFLTRGDGYAARLDADGFDLLLAPAPGGPAAGHLRLDFAGATGSGSVLGEDPSPGVVNYLRGASPGGWIVGVPIFGAVKYADLYPGIDLTVSGNRRQLMLRFDLESDSDPGAVTLHFDEDARTEIDPRTGDLLVGTAGATVRLRPPAGTAFTLESGAVTWSVSGAGPGEARTISMTLDRRLTGDPSGIAAVAPALTDEEVTRVAVGSDGGTYVTGRALAIGADGAEAFVARYDRADKRPIYTTYFGGSAEDVPLGLVVTANHEAIVGGWTRSTDFPIANALQPVLAGASGAFVLRLSADGATPIFSTYLGGGGDEEARSVALGEDGEIWIAGRTRSFSTLPRHASTPAIGSGLRGGYDALVAALDGDGLRLLDAVDLGGIGDDSAEAVGLDSSGRVWIAGSSTSPDFPAPAAGAGPAPQGRAAGASSSHAFVVALDPDSLAPSFVSRIESGGTVTATG